MKNPRHPRHLRQSDSPFLFPDNPEGTRIMETGGSIKGTGFFFHITASFTIDGKGVYLIR